MTRDERIAAALKWVGDWETARVALDAALADVGGLDGLEQEQGIHEVLRADIDRLRGALKTVIWESRAALRDIPIETRREGDSAPDDPPLPAFAAAQADRDRLRNALRKIAAGREDDRYDGMEDVPGQRLSRTALREVAALALHRSESEALS